MVNTDDPELPDNILTEFEERWAGTTAELYTALEHFYNDIRSSVALSLKTAWPLGSPLSGSKGVMQQADVLDALDDYFANHYGEP